MAELVTTNRLHVALPCLAFGTPLHFVRKNIWQKHRLTLLDHLRVKDGETTRLDLSGHAQIYRQFLMDHLGDHRSDEPKTPVWRSIR
jgi:hypothetical protein